MKKLFSILLTMSLVWGAGEVRAADKPDTLCDRVCGDASCLAKPIYDACLKCTEDRMKLSSSKISLEKCKKAGKEPENAGGYEYALNAACTGITCKDPEVKKICLEARTEYEQLCKEGCGKKEGLLEVKTRKGTQTYGKEEAPRHGAFKACENAK